MKYKLLPYIEKKLKDVNKEDKYVSVVALLLDLDAESGIGTIKDGDEEVVIIISKKSVFSKLFPNKKYLFYGMVMPFENGFELKIENASEMDNLDEDLYEKYLTLKKQKI